MCVIGMEFLPLSRRRSSSRNVPSSEEGGETDVFAGYRYMKIAHDLVTDQSGTGDARLLANTPLIRSLILY